MLSNFLFHVIHILFLVNISLSRKDSFSQISPTLLNLAQCTPFAYGDFNADKLIDIFCVSNPGD
jgi:hypothetical protein